MVSVLKRNNVKIIGKGEKVIFFAHGFGCDQNSWKYVKDAFLEDYKVVLFDYVGAGNSDTTLFDEKKYSSLSGYATDVLEIFNELKLKEVIFVGHSVSCMIGVLAAIQQPEIFKKFIFIGPSPCYINKGDYTGGFDQQTIDSLLEVMEEDYIVWARSLATTVMSDKNDPLIGQELSDGFCSIDPKIAKSFARVTFLSDNRKDLVNIPVESLTIQASHDNIAPLSVGEYINKHAPNNTLKVLEAYGHCPHMSHSRETIDAMLTYLNQC